jgi:NitT/TauT family transport system substrate-binding protein
LPYYEAEQNGYFDQVGVQVEAVPVKSARERDALMQAGQIDGMLTGVNEAVPWNRDEAQVKIVRLARKPYPGAPGFTILAAPGSTVASPLDLAGVLGIAQFSVIEYVTDCMLKEV